MLFCLCSAAKCVQFYGLFFLVSQRKILTSEWNSMRFFTFWYRRIKVRRKQLTSYIMFTLKMNYCQHLSFISSIKCTGKGGNVSPCKKLVDDWSVKSYKLMWIQSVCWSGKTDHLTIQDTDDKLFQVDHSSYPYTKSLSAVEICKEWLEALQEQPNLFEKVMHSITSSLTKSSFIYWDTLMPRITIYGVRESHIFIASRCNSLGQLRQLSSLVLTLVSRYRISSYNEFLSFCHELLE